MLSRSKNTGIGIISAVLSGVLLLLSFPSFNLYLLEWFAFIPLLFALECRSLRQSYLLGVVTGTVAIFGGFNWMADWAANVMKFPFPLDQIASLAYAFCIGHIFGFIALLYQWIRLKRIAVEILIFPVVVVATFSVFPMLFYFKLGDAQSYFLPAIQGIEFTGVYGLDFIIAMANILVYKSIQFSGDKTARGLWVACLLVLAVWFGYGVISLRHWDSKIENWQSKVVGLVQPNRPALLTRPKPEKGYSRQYPLEMEMSQELAKGGAEVIFWPEGHFFGYVFWSSVRESFQHLIGKMSIPFMIYDSTVETINGKKHFYNSTIWIDEQGNQVDIYHKMKLVPFGEYTPLIGQLPIIKSLLGNYMSDLSAGTKHKTFAVAGMKIVPKICYEPLFPFAVAASVRDEPAGKVLLVQSQDGWYGETSEPEQHMTETVLRAVENRIPLIHVINNGASAVVLPNGRYVYRTPAFVRGAWNAKMPYSAESGGSFFSRYPFLFIGTIWVVLLALAWPGIKSLLLNHRMSYLFRIKNRP